MQHPLLSRQGQVLAACYLAFFATLGLLVPYLGLYLDHLGLDSLAIGQLLAILFATRILAPNLWAALADHTGRRVAVIRWGATVAGGVFLAMHWAEGFWTLALVMALFTFFWNAILAQLEVVTLSHLSGQTERYGTLRSFGSFGYILMVTGAGWWFAQAGPGHFPWLGSAVFLLLISACWLLRESPTPPSERQPDGQGLWQTLRQPPVWLFLLSAMLIQASHGPFYTFYVLYLKGLGFSEGVAGALVALGVTAEIGIFALAPRLLRRWSVPTLLCLACLLAALRWALTAEGGASLSWQLLAASLHAFSFGLTHACSIQLVHRRFAAAHQSKAQALYASLSFGVGGALGAYLSGVMWHNGAGATQTWWLASAAAGLAAIGVLLMKVVDDRRQTTGQAV
ncbi:MFS transporter [Ferrimonas marina]|uniref:MFS transporter, PPP family, 3-phenylpropionic acid transporter n=1 Tax=Ferrimonas marina TaxID=299255 RepID=A0A1M5YA80_9GAMM|nr:MFS transporter [Ferrimonas marina]SHI08744.1 MFS transporter, PPP family, 3-phenylpropionic acid transporter [Ferrimonas marina]